jgi:hypothetical protein
LVSTLAVCGVAALIVPPASVTSLTMDESAIAAASSQTLPGHGWTADVLAPDVPDTDDDDGGDDAPAPSAVVPSAHSASHRFDRSWLLEHLVVISRASHVLEGHALRGPPVEDDDSSDADRDDDDDDDDDDTLRTERSGAAPANADLVAATDEHDDRPIYTLPILDAHLPISFVFDVQSLRAPPR